MSGTDVFLSYAREDRATARLFTECLRTEGFTVWWDASLHSGETFDEVIERNLREASAVVVLWSPRSVASRWVRAEATLADRRSNLVPAIIEPCDRPIIFELTHAAELVDWSGDTADPRWRSFVEDVQRLVEAAETHRPQPKSPAKTKNDQSGSAQAAARRPLRPGHDEVIGSKIVDRAPPVPPAVGREPEDDAPNVGEVHCLEFEDSEIGEGIIAVTSSGAKLGRTPPADFLVPHNSVSREHCMIGLAHDELIVTDLNSTNGTYIDDVRITRTTILPVGSVVRLGKVALRHAVRSGAEATERQRVSARS